MAMSSKVGVVLRRASPPPSRRRRAGGAARHEIAAFLSKANPQSWPLAATTSMMNGHLALTTKEAVDELRGRWTASASWRSSLGSSWR